MSVFMEEIYSAPFKVETMTEMRASSECLTFFLSMAKRDKINLFHSFVVS